MKNFERIFLIRSAPRFRSVMGEDGGEDRRSVKKRRRKRERAGAEKAATGSNWLALQRKTKLFLNHTLNFHILCCIRGCCPKSCDHRLVSKHLQDRYKDSPLDSSIILYRDNCFLWISTVLRSHRTRAFCRPTTSRQLQDPDLRSRHRVSIFVYLLVFENVSNFLMIRL